MLINTWAICDEMMEDKKKIKKTDLSVIAVIPARGGSKGIPRKNITNVAGKPLIAYMIEAAKSSKFISKIFVSTDDAEIASVAKMFNAEVIERPSGISGDNSPSELALLNVLDHLQKNNQKKPEILVFLQCTSPLTSVDDIDQTITKLLSEKADTAFTVTPTHVFLWAEDSNGEAIGINHDKKVRKMRQECQPQYIETGSVYVMRCEGFLKNKHRFFGKTVLSVIPPERALDIDEPADIPRAEYAIQKQKELNKIQRLPKNIDGIVFDFDGVFTDNNVCVHDDGSEAVTCNRSDGMGITALKKGGFPLLVMSKEKNPVVQKRCEKLGIPCAHGIDDKKTYLKTWLKTHTLNPQNIVYLGNDINDIDCLTFVGCGVVVADAHEDAKMASRIILKKNGGQGAVRELCDLVLSRNNRN